MRCFIALPLPPGAREALARGLSPLRGRRPDLAWVAPEGYHLTLAFLGELDEARADCARLALEGCVEGRGFGFRLGGLGYLPPRGSPRVLYARLEESPAGASEALYRLVNEALEVEGRRAGLPPLNQEWAAGGRPYRAHVTLARLRPGQRAPSRESLSSLHFGPREWTIDRCLLYKSDLRRGGAVYTELGGISLEPTEARG